MLKAHRLPVWPPRQTCPLLCRVGTAHPCRVAGCSLGNEPWISAETFIRPDRLSVNADARSSGRGRALAGKLLSQGSYATRCWCRPLVAGRKRRQRFPLCGGCWNRRSSSGGCSWHVRRAEIGPDSAAEDGRDPQRTRTDVQRGRSMQNRDPHHLLPARPVSV